LHITAHVVELLDPQNPANSPPPDFVSYWRNSHETAPNFVSADGFNGCNGRLLRHGRRLLRPTRLCPSLRRLQRVRTCTVQRMQRRRPCDDGRASHFVACSRDAWPSLQRSVLASLSASSIDGALPRCVRSIAALNECLCLTARPRKCAQPSCARIKLHREHPSYHPECDGARGAECLRPRGVVCVCEKRRVPVYCAATSMRACGDSTGATGSASAHFVAWLAR
jgi:hypothetical protein